MTPAEPDDPVGDLAYLRIAGLVLAGFLWTRYCIQMERKREQELAKVSLLLRARARQLEER